MSEKKEMKCSYNCKTCQNHDRKKDFCIVKKIENCSKIAPTEFSTCTDYLISDRLIMF